MDICPLPQSSCYLTSSCLLQISSPQSFWSQPRCCLPCLAPLTEHRFLTGFCLCWMLPPLPLQPPCFSPMLKPCCTLALPCSRHLLALCSPPSWLFLPPLPLTFNAMMLAQIPMPASPSELMRLGSILFFTATCLHCNPLTDQQP